MPAFVLEKTNNDVVLKNKYGVYSRNELEQQLREGHFTAEELGDIYGLKTYQIVHVLRTLEITYKNKLNDVRISDPSITPSMHQVLLGTLLGDAYMKCPKSYSLGHGINQMDYCYHVAERLHPFIASFGDKNTDCATKKSFEFWTYRHDIFKPYFDRFYSRGRKKKYFNKGTVFDLNPEGLAYWCMDDGKYNRYGFHLCVGKITEEEASVLMALLRDKFNIYTTFQVQSIEKSHYNLYVKAESRNHFISLISPYIIKSMRYKIEGTSPSQEVFSKEAVFNKHHSLCKKAKRFIRYFGDKNVQDYISSNIEIKGPKIIYRDKIIELINSGKQVSHTFFSKAPSKEVLIELLNQNMSDKQIAERLRVGRNRIGELRRLYGIERKSKRISPAQHDRLLNLFNTPGMTIQKAQKHMRMSFYKIKDWLKNYSPDKCHQRLMKEKEYKKDIEVLTFNPSDFSIAEYTFSREDYSEKIKSFIEKYEWLRSVGVFSKYNFVIRLQGEIAGVQILNEPTSYSKILGDNTPKWECLIQRGCTVSWAHPHLGSRLLMMSVNWMVRNTEKRLFIGYSDPSAGEIGTIYQACNFKYLGDKFGVPSKYIHPTYKDGKEFCEHSLKRTGVFKWWCRQNGIKIESSWIKPNGFKDIKEIPESIKRAWYNWGKEIISESKEIIQPLKGKYVLIKGKDKREQRYLESLFKKKTYPYPKRAFKKSP